MALDADQWRLTALRLLCVLAPFNLVVQRDSDLLRQPLVALALTIGVCICASALAVRPRLLRTHRLFFVAWVAWVLLLWASALLSPERWLSSGAAARISVAAIVMAATVLVVREKRHAASLLRSLVAGAAVAVALGAIVQLLGEDFSESDRFFGSITELGPYDRLTRPWAHANVAAMAIGASITGVAAIRSPRLRFAAGTWLVIGAVLTYSRGVFISLFLGAIVWALLRVRSGHWTRLGQAGLAALVGVAIVAALVTPGWTARASGDDQLAWWQVELDAPSSISLGAAPVSTTIGVSNASAVMWPRAGDAPVLLTARWVVPETDIVRAEHRWMLPLDVAPGDEIDVDVAIDPIVPNGSYDVHWDLFIDERAYFRQFAGLPAVVSQGMVDGATIPDEQPAVGSRVPPRQFPGRTEIWSAAIDAFTDAPLFGAGPGRLRQTMPEEANAGHGHNLVLEPLATWGVLATTPMVLLVAGALVVAWRRAWLDRDQLSTAVVVGLVIASAHGMVDWSLIHVSVAIPFGLLCGLGWARWTDRSEAGDA